MFFSSAILSALLSLTAASQIKMSNLRSLQKVGNGKGKKMKRPCTLLLRVEEFADDTDAYEWNCELDPEDSDGDIVSLEFPSEKPNKNSFESGVSTLFGDVTIANGKATVKGNPIFGRRKSKENNSGRHLLTGNREVLAIRVEANDIETTADEVTIADEIFGSNGDTFNLATGFTQCSYNELNFIPTPDNRIGADGVYTVVLNEDVSTLTDSELRNKVVNAATNELGSLSSQFDHVMLCLPNIAGFGGIAYAYINSWLSVYKDVWCNYPSAQLHEIGHNIGLAHSGEGSQQYADQTGMMGYSYSNDEGPRMCFNNAKNWQLGWYTDRRAIVTPLASDWTGDLVGLAEYDLTTTDQVVILKIEGDTVDYYVGFNRALGINSGTVEGKNQVTIQSRSIGTGYAQSTLVAKLSAGGSFSISNFGGTVETVTVDVVSINTASSPGVATVNIYKEQNPTPSPTKSPTKAPSSSPTKTPTKAPSSTPTAEPTTSPTKPPTKSPSSAPTDEPTTSPTSSPTSSPTKPPTKSPSSTPTASPTSSPTKSPTKSPSSAPTAKPIGEPTSSPTKSPTAEPSAAPTAEPTASPTKYPTAEPTASPTKSPTAEPSAAPTAEPTTSPTESPTAEPSAAPTAEPTASPTKSPTVEPSSAPTAEPTVSPTKSPTVEPSSAPTASPTFPVTPSPTKSPVVGPECSSFINPPKCRNTSGCIWFKGECKDLTCSLFTAKGQCKNNGCQWSNKVCIDP